MKGFFFTMDAVLAIVFSLILFTLTLAAFQISVPRADASVALAWVAEDFVAGLEKSGALETAVNTSSNGPIVSQISALPPELCPKVIVKKHGAGTVVATDPGCRCRGQKTTGKRGFAIATAAGFEEYVATVELCRRD